MCVFQTVDFTWFSLSVRLSVIWICCDQWNLIFFVWKKRVISSYQLRYNDNSHVMSNHDVHITYCCFLFEHCWDFFFFSIFAEFSFASQTHRTIACKVLLSDSNKNCFRMEVIILSSSEGVFSKEKITRTWRSKKIKPNSWCIHFGV